MINNILFAILFIAVALTGYYAVTQSLENKRIERENNQGPVEVHPSPIKTFPPEPQLPSPKEPEEEIQQPPSQETEENVEVPEIPTIPEPPKEPFGPNRSNHYAIELPEDHSYRISLIGSIWSKTFPSDDFNREVVGDLFLQLAQQKIEALFISDFLFLPEKVDDKVLDEVKKRIQNLYSLAKDILGSSVKIFPAFECSLDNAPKVMPLIDSIFELPLRDPLAPYDVAIDDSVFIVISTHGFDPKVPVIDRTKEIFNNLYFKPKFTFVIGYDAPFPATPFVKNTLLRGDFWNLLVRKKVTAYFSFHEQLFNRLYRQGIWQITAGGGGAPVISESDSEAFYHCIILRIPTNDHGNPTVQDIDTKGNVIDEFDLIDSNSPLHQLHISG